MSTFPLCPALSPWHQHSANSKLSTDFCWMGNKDWTRLIYLSTFTSKVNTEYLLISNIQIYRSYREYEIQRASRDNSLCKAFPGEIHFLKPGTCSFLKWGSITQAPLKLFAPGEQVSGELREASQASVLSRAPGNIFSLLMKKVNNSFWWLCRHSRNICLTEIFLCLAQW